MFALSLGMRVLAIVVLLFGCGEDNVAPERGEPPPVAETDESAEPVDPRPSAGEAPAESESERVGERASAPADNASSSEEDDEEADSEAHEPTPEEIAREVVRLESTVAAALAAAEEAETASTACEAAHDGLAAMIAEVAAQYPDQTRPVPPRRAFIRVCERLDHAVQQCLLPTYASVHTAECEVLAAAIAPEDRARLDEVLRSE